MEDEGPTMASEILIYAELLSNIRQISLAVSLPSPVDNSTRASVAADGLTFAVWHHGHTRTLTLPAKAALGATSLPLQNRGATTLSWRLPVSPDDLPQSPVSQGSLWSATDLDAGSGVACRACGASLVQPNAVIWKDLPSENWAEMMEFWHCHKPAVDPNHSHPGAGSEKADEASLASRGYGASSVISAQKGVGFVDLTTILLAESDCDGLTFSHSHFAQGSPNRQDLPEIQSRSLNIFCSSCRAQLGFFNFRTAAVTLLKWQISCKSASGILPGIPECLAATLTSTISRSGSAKSLITPIPDSQEKSDQAIHIWVLNSGIVYSSSAISQSTPAIKLLYKEIGREQADRMLEDLNCDAQEINLPAKAISSVLDHLDESNMMLPSTERALKGWKVGLLKR
ncbi:ubiquitin-conjugating enzyme E2-binding protein [Echria macrotheca]|uniref:Ubiquitin-conjugating enzyme E2-binding protein n=1 Tax=Echria macrotheca TaxID=438768 RepID=A0AAJ0BLV0_9PEZI|nr:ubiquitin-conjugating enzyme E2-binding protein [Echria macrotheca]